MRYSNNKNNVKDSIVYQPQPDNPLDPLRYERGLKERCTGGLWKIPNTGEVRGAIYLDQVYESSTKRHLLASRRLAAPPTGHTPSN